jgi:zinc/manganese transport system substrate-binding protein
MKRSLAWLMLIGVAVIGGRLAHAQQPIHAVGIENEYADVIAQIGGKYVQVTAIESDPNVDPHTFEASPKVAAELAGAQLIIENGLGYDSWADKMIAATSNSGRRIINVQHLMRLDDSTPNPHLWYDPKVMPVVAQAIADDLAAFRPAEAKYFHDNLRAFDASLQPWLQAIATFKAAHPDTPVAVTEPVADYMVEAAGCAILTPFSLQAAIMNGNDPSPQDVTKQQALLASHKAKAFLYNRQVTDSLTQSFLELAKKAGVPVVAVYETMPTPGFTYQSWMLAQTRALQKAVAGGESTSSLGGTSP